MKTRLKDSGWRHGSITYRNLVVWVQEAKLDEWFAAIRDEGLALLAYSGPWSTQRKAEHKLIEAFEAIFESGWNDPPREAGGM